MPEILNVWYKHHLAGTLKQAERGAVVFQYSQAWLESDNSFAISLSLPLSDTVFTPELSTAFFDNYLPEERLRDILIKEHNIESDTIFSLLKAFGAECAGALSILPDTEKHTKEHFQYKALNNGEVAQYIAHLPASPLLGGYKEIRLSLAGAQSKGALRITADGKFFIPQHNSPSTHIIKPYNQNFPNLPENEIFCMGLAKAMGLDTPLFFLSETLPKAFIVKRYDRIIHNDHIERIHQEDFCQPLGISNINKYQKYGKGATLVDCFALLRYCENPQAEAIKLLQWVIYNICIGNADAHAKNISLLYDQKKPRLAPFYDLISTAPYHWLSQKLAMKIDDTNDGDRIFSSKWKRFAASIGISYESVCAIGSDLTSNLLNQIDDICSRYITQYSYFRELDEIVSIIKKRSTFLLEQWR